MQIVLTTTEGHPPNSPMLFIFTVLALSESINFSASLFWNLLFEHKNLVTSLPSMSEKIGFHQLSSKPQEERSDRATALHSKGIWLEFRAGHQFCSKFITISFAPSFQVAGYCLQLIHDILRSNLLCAVILPFNTIWFELLTVSLNINIIREYDSVYIL